jgi:hypothetical protein
MRLRQRAALESSAFAFDHSYFAHSAGESKLHLDWTQRSRKRKRYHSVMHYETSEPVARCATFALLITFRIVIFMSVTFMNGMSEQAVL